MFYRVTILEKNDNHREMIVKAENKAAALAQIPAAKAFLFPGEDASEYTAFVSTVHLDVLEARVPHWRITVTRPQAKERVDGDWEDWQDIEPRTFTMTVKADSPEEAIQMAREDVDYPNEAYAKEVSVAELIAEEEDYLRYRIKEEFFTAKSPDISIREFSNLMKGKNQTEAEVEETFYEAIQFFLSKNRLRNALTKSIDLSKISAAEYETLISKLPLAADRDSFNTILDEAKAKYGKA